MSETLRRESLGLYIAALNHEFFLYLRSLYQPFILPQLFRRPLFRFRDLPKGRQELMSS